MRSFFSKIRPAPELLLLFGLTLIALAPLFNSGYFYDAHDGRHSVFYLIQFDASLRDGALWPRWAMHHIQGYGYPTFILQAPLGFYLAELFVLLGAGYTLAVKFTWAVGFLISGWGMAALVRYWLDRSAGTSRPQHRLAALVAGLLYVFIPYHLADIYVRAALNDTLLLAWFPWVLLTLDQLIDQGFASGWRRRLVLAVLVLGGCLLTHTFALLSFTPLVILFVLFRLAVAQAQSHDWRIVIGRAGLAAAAGLLALLLIATFLFPLLAEGPYLEQQVYVTNTYDFHNHFVQWGQFFSPFWGFGFSDDPAGANDGMGFQIGVVALLLAIVAGYVTVRESEPAWLRRAYLGFLTVISLILLFLMTPSATLLWESFPFLAVIQFPWRLLALTAFTLSTLAGLVVPLLLDNLLGQRVPSDSPDRSVYDAGVVILALVIMLASFPYIQAQLSPIEPWREDGRAVFRFEQEHPDMIAYTQWVKEPFTTSPMSAEYASPDYVEDYSANGFLTRLAIIQGSGEILSQYSRGSSGGGVVRVDGPATIRIHLYYFPGWQVQVDGQPVEARVSDPHGLIEVDVSGGEHRIDVRMGSTPPRRAGTLTSWTTLLLLLGLWLYPSRRGRKRREPQVQPPAKGS
ncbi:MAG: hypothetical protein IT328_08490 [Caldilineaceae bacterium]|nr:hypothetical protein [Caldilineaceae bacterium]